MNVVIIADSDPRKKVVGGAGIYASNLLKYLTSKGHHVTFIGKNMEGKAIHSFKNFDFIEVNDKPKQSNYTFLRNLFALERRISLPENSVIHSQRPDWLVPFCGRKNRKIVTLHGSHAKNVFLKKGFLIGKIYSRLERKGLGCADAVISVSDHDADAYRKKYPFFSRKITVIPVGVDIGKFKNLDRNKARKKLGFSAKDKVVVGVGRLEKEKNYDLLIRACKEAGVKLLLAGEGREEEKLKMLARRIRADVAFQGAVDNEKIPSLLACGDVFALVSTHEGLPTVVIEALAAGLPVVATDVGDMRKLVVDGTGLISSEKDVAKNIERALKLRSAKNCQKKAADYSIEKICSRIMGLYGK